MSINIGPASTDELRPKITVIGIGGAGGNAIANMIESEIEGVDFIAANTDAQALTASLAEKRIQLGPDITGGLGAGARPEVGRAAAEETVKEIEDALDGVNMVFIAAGMGGGTGTGAAPVIAEAARAKGVLTVGVVTKPFLFEGTRRMRAAEAGIEELQKHVDTLIVIPNQNLFLIAKPETTFKEAFQLADEVLQQGVRSITDLMVMPGLINLDFADVRSVMSEMGKAMMGTGEAEGESRALDAAERAIANPLLDGVSMQGAKGVIISIIGGEDMKLLEVDEAANHIRELVDEDANIIWGSAFNPDLDGKIRVSVVATGIEGMAEGAGSADSAPVSLSSSRAPKRPVMALSSDDGEGAQGDPLDLEDTQFDAGDDAVEAGIEENADDGMALDLSGLQSDDDEGADEEGDDVDGIVDPLEGLRSEAESSDEGDDGALDLSLGDEAESGDDSALDLTTEAADVDAAAEDESVQPKISGRRRGLLGGVKTAEEEAPAAPVAEPAPAAAPAAAPAPAAGGGAGGGGGGGAPAAAGGSTLFERMANLSRGSDKGSDSGDDEDEDDDGDGSSLSIPRFLGRQNNQ
ncbi:MAG: cell division protein FtsZ [Erythrobacter sp.]